MNENVRNAHIYPKLSVVIDSPVASLARVGLEIIFSRSVLCIPRFLNRIHNLEYSIPILITKMSILH